MPRSPSKLRILPEAADDIEEIQQDDSEGATRILKKINEWKDQIQWGRVPQRHLTYLSGSKSYNFYRQRVGNSKYRVVYEISDDLMTAVAVFPKDDNAYDLDDYRSRMDRQ
ncbi:MULTISPECIES: type II toxin-antitoxin system RelE family toxin [Haloferacaceae]|uniref:Type II toxin-antitoxin system RelE/ParE family toxin n=1 Tax=Halorubrum glutamatedens TaxID=2707018 RepID=A0ABD5QSG2_9EURY|nr:type II toxin-antitoxin system RelE/ParE family toxin [Halobellus captivus]